MSTRGKTLEQRQKARARQIRKLQRIARKKNRR